MQIYVHRNNQQLGPFTEAEINAQLASGAITPQDHVWWQGQTSWVPLGQSTLMDAGAPAVPVTPAVPTAPAAPMAAGVAQPTPSAAIWSLVLGCLGFFFSIFTAIPAIILGHISLNRIKKNPGMKGRGFALAGTILGYVFTALLPVVSIIAISVLIALGNQVKGTFTTIQAQLNAAAATNSSDQSPSDSTTNSAPAAAAPDQTTNAPDQSTAATTNSTPSSTNAPDQSTNAAPGPVITPSTNGDNSTPSTNAPASSTNTAPLSQ